MLTLLNLPRKTLICFLHGVILGLFVVAVIIFFSCYGGSWCLDRAIGWLKGKPLDNKISEN
jgi:hypothetical protein